MSGAYVFHNKAGKKFGEKTGRMYDTHNMKISADVFPPVSGTIKPNETFEFKPKINRSKVTFEIKSDVVGWPTFKLPIHDVAALARNVDYYIVESHHGVKFNVALEWPPRNPDKL